VLQDDTVQDVSLEVLDGNVTIDDKPIHRRWTIDMTDSIGNIVPAAATDLLSPLAGTELKLWRGIEFPDGTQELLPLGVCGITDLRIDDSGQGLHMRATCMDRAERVSASGLPDDYNVPAGANYVEQIEILLRSVWPDIPLSLPSTPYLTPKLVFLAGADPWEKAQTMATNIGCDLYFDPNGLCIMQPVIADKSPDWAYEEGEDSMLLYVNRRLNRDTVYNHTIVVGESTSLSNGPVRGEAMDLDPSSPTYVHGRFGNRLKRRKTSQVTTTPQAVEAAQRDLVKYSGLPEQLEVQTLVHPAHEINDFFTVVREDTKVDSIYVASKITIPLVHDRPIDMSVRVRGQTDA
jgi:hypothetical protein